MIGGGVGGATCPAPVISREVLTFNGTNAYGQLSTPITLTGDFEIEVVFSLAVGATGDLVFCSSNDENLFFRIDAINGSLDIKYNRIFYANDGLITPDTKMHTAKVNYTGTSIKKYYDGLSVGTHSSATATQTITDIGWRAGGIANYFNGKIYSIKITDNSGATPVVYEYQLNQGKTDVTYASGDVTKPVIHWNNILSTDYERYVLHRDVNKWISTDGLTEIDIA